MSNKNVPHSEGSTSPASSYPGYSYFSYRLYHPTGDQTLQGTSSSKVSERKAGLLGGSLQLGRTMDVGRYRGRPEIAISYVMGYGRDEEPYFDMGHGQLIQQEKGN